MRRLVPKLSPFARRLALRLFIAVMIVYLSIGGVVWRSMHQTPEQFASVMAKFPGPAVFILYPFETLWMKARAGALQVGDAAPDFSLMKVDKSARIQLSALTKQQPVVLVFGSYT